MENQRVKLVTGVQLYLVASVVRGGLLARQGRPLYSWRGQHNKRTERRREVPDYELLMPSKRPPSQKV